MSRILSDTDEAASRVMVELWARMTPAQKLERVRDLTLTACQLTLAGLRARYPAEDDEELFHRLTRIRLGDEIADRVYAAGKRPDGA